MKTISTTVGTLCLVLLGNGYNSPAQAAQGAGQPPTANEGARTTPAQNRIVEGEGWRGFKVGATRAELVWDLGQPDSDSDNRWLKWQKHSVHCLMDETRGAFELRFDKGFQGTTTSGIQIGSPLKDALDAYGKPSSQLDKGTAKRLTWTSKGILIWFNDDKATQIVVFPKTPKTAEAGG